MLLRKQLKQNNNLNNIAVEEIAQIEQYNNAVEETAQIGQLI